MLRKGAAAGPKTVRLPSIVKVNPIQTCNLQPLDPKLLRHPCDLFPLSNDSAHIRRCPSLWL